MNKILFFILFYSFAYSQSQEESIKKNENESYYQKCSYFVNTNKDSLKFYIKKLKSSNNKCYIHIGNTFEAKLAYLNEEFRKAELICKQTLAAIENQNDNCFFSVKISLYTRLFWLKKRLGAYDEAYYYLTKQSDLIYSLPEKDDFFHSQEFILKNHLAIIKSELGLYDETLNILKSQLPYFTNKDNSGKFKTYRLKKNKADLFNSLGNTYFSLAKKKQNIIYLDSASIYYHKSFEVSKTFVPTHNDSEIIYAFKKTKVLIALKKYREALESINNYTNINTDFKYQHNEYFQKLVCFYNLNENDSTIFYANKILENKKQDIERNNLITLYDILSNKYHELNEHDSAYKYSKLTMKHYELAKKNKEETFQLLYENDFEKAKELNQKIKTQEGKKQYHLLVLFTIILVLVFLLMFFNSRKKQNKKQIIINELKKQTPAKETSKKEYNISEKLEKQILDEVEKANTTLLFLNADFSINTIAESIHTNSTYVSFVFNKHYKESFKQYYTKIRIDYVVERLKKDATFRKYSVQGIGEEIGYTNASAFTRAFKKQMGITPSVFLRAID